ncbi:hypothetical protein LCGC14_0413270 [marine sediment metagenome]|uniref:Phage head morphogenesis domain-containing protein n=1 Tax=marine sediment metagenome TaxID=412755 RepID=A0A0F9ST64_9ZZZZ
MESLTDLYEDGAAAIEEILSDVYHLDVAKALNPTNRGDFLTIVNRLSRSLKRATAGDEAKVLRAALKRLDVDWPNLSAAQRARAVTAATRSLAPLPKAILPKVDKVFEVSGTRVVGQTRKAVKRRFRLKIQSATRLVDRRATRELARSQANFITDQLGLRRQNFSAQARRIVSDGLERGLGRKAIAEQLQSKLTASSLRQSKSYWQVIASSFVNRARTTSSLLSFKEAGLDRYIFEAVLDEATTEVCRFMHEKTFTVDSGLKRLDSVRGERDSDKVKAALPWVRDRKDSKGRDVMAFEREDGSQQSIGVVQEPGFGEADKIGTYTNTMSDKGLEKNGIQQPPLHGFCRSTVVPEV